VPDGGFPARVDSQLLELASQQATGCLTLTDPEGEQALVWFRDGDVYAVSVPGRRPLLGVRLMSSGALTPEALAEALEVQRTELQGWRLGELLVRLGFVERAVVEAFVCEQVRDQVADLLHWHVTERKFRNGKRTRQDVAPPMAVTDLLASARRRDEQWAAIVPFIGGADAVPVLSTAAPASSDVILGPYDWSLLCKVDGNRTVADLADDCGFTVHEAGMVVVGLLEAGLVEIDGGEAEETAVPWWTEDNPTDDEVAASVAKVTAALSDMGLTATRSPFTAAPSLAPPAEQRRPSPFTAAPAVALAEVVSLDAEREARDEQDRRAAEDAARREAERIEAERLAAEEAARVEAERVEAERLAAEEAARLEAERVEAERLAAEEAERVEAERAAQEEMTRWAAEEAERHAQEAARLALEREQAELLARGLAEPVPGLEEPMWAQPAEVAPAFEIELEPEPVSAASFADIYGAVSAPEPEVDDEPAPVVVLEPAASYAASFDADVVEPAAFEPGAFEPPTFEPAAESMPESMPESLPEVVPARVPDYSGGFVVNPQVTQPQASDGADMAALLRELSSLGAPIDDGARPGMAGMAGMAGNGQVVTRPAPAQDPKAKKKKGFFGR